MLLIKTTRDALLKPLQTVAGIIERRQAYPILSNVLIRQDQEKATFLASDMDIQIKTELTSSLAAEQNFSITVSAKKFLDILRSLPADSEIRCTRQDDQLRVRSGKSTFNLQILPAEDFPEIVEVSEPEAVVIVTQKILKNLLHHVQFCIAQQNIRYYMNGLLLSTEEKQLTGVSTDGHRMALLVTQSDQMQPRHEVIIPRKTAIELSKQLIDSDDPVKIEYFQKKVRFSFANISLISKVIEGKFPDYNRVIPQNNNKSFEINRLMLLQSLQRVSILSNTNENFRGVRLIIDPGILCIICKNSDQEEAREELEIEYQQESLDISMNISYLLDLLSAIDSEKIQLAFENENSSVLITIPGDDKFKYIVMPMRI